MLAIATQTRHNTSFLIRLQIRTRRTNVTTEETVSQKFPCASVSSVAEIRAITHYFFGRDSGGTMPATR